MSKNASIVFILSDARSGSTLLDQLLGANSDVVSLGEVHWLAAYVLQDRRIYDPVHALVCSCGSIVPQCEFWKAIAEHMDVPLQNLRLHPRCFGKAHKFSLLGGITGRIRRLPRRLVESFPGLYKLGVPQRLLGGKSLGIDSLALFDAISSVTGASHIVDSSKSVFRFWTIFAAAPARVRAILLARDYRAVANSKMNRGRSLDDAAIGWRKKILQMEVLTQDVGLRNLYRIKYEDLCANPRQELESICQFLELEFSERMLQRPSEGMHHIGGSPSKFDPSKSTIRLDEKHRDAFTEQELRRMRDLVGEAAEIWDY